MNNKALFGLGPQISILILIPIIILLGVIFHLKNTNMLNTQIANQEIYNLNKASRNIHAGSIKISDTIRSMSAYMMEIVQAWQNSIAYDNKDRYFQELEKSINGLRLTSKKTNEFAIQYIENLKKNHLVPSDEKINQNFESKNHDRWLLWAKANLIVRISDQIPRITDIYLDSARRTNSLLKDNRLNDAKSNYIYEESVRLEMLKRMFADLSLLAKNFNADISKEIYKSFSEQYIRIEERTHTANSTATLYAQASGLFLAILAALFAYIRLAKPLMQTSQLMESVLNNESVDAFKYTNRKDEIGKMSCSLLAFIKAMEENVKSKQALEESAVKNAQLTIALDQINTGMLLINKSGELVYANQSIKETLKSQTAYPEVGKDLGLIAFDLINKSNIENQQKAGLFDNPQEFILPLGSEVYRVLSVPLSQNTRIGENHSVLMQWVNQTSQLEVEREIDLIIDKVSQGDLRTQISESGKVEFYLRLTQGLNTINKETSSVLMNVNSVLSGLAKGNLHKRMEGQYQGTYGRLQKNLNYAIQKLSSVTTSVQSGIVDLCQNTSEISHCNSNLKDVFGELSNSIDDINQSTLRLAKQSDSISQQADASKHSAKSALNSAQDSIAVISSAMQSMEKIQLASQNVSTIVDVINEISAQTNLLALNAAVEAARAGASGRGFAVVATEVRSLAMRCTESASEISALISESNEQVKEGSKFVTQSESALNSITKEIQAIHSALVKMDETAKEQNKGTHQASSAVERIKEKMSTSEEMVIQVANNTQELFKQAGQIEVQVNFFGSRPGKQSTQ